MPELYGTSLYNDAQLKAYYRMSAGALTTDSKGSFTLTNTNSVANGTGKYAGGADYGSGATKRLHKSGSSFSDSTAHMGLSASGSKTYIGWFNKNDTPSVFIQHVFNNGGSGSGNQSCIMVLSYDGTKFTVSSSTTGGSNSDYTIAVSSGWHQVGLLQNSTTLNVIYDGQIVGSNGTFGTLVGAYTPEFSLGNGNSNTQSCKSILDDWAIFNKALSAAEIDSLYDKVASSAWFLFV